MSEEEYLEKLVNDFGENQDYTNDEKKEFSDILKKLITINNNDGTYEEIINIIIKKS
tara:strand:+ start:1137 stop:1307 length:171 start_codon:yes stop_codon:yes gene_type:complete